MKKRAETPTRPTLTLAREGVRMRQVAGGGLWPAPSHKRCETGETTYVLEKA